VSADGGEGGEVLEQVPTKSNDDAFLSLLLERSYLQETLQQKLCKKNTFSVVDPELFSGIRILFSMSFRIRILQN
jgi:hypothetical protein